MGIQPLSCIIIVYLVRWCKFLFDRANCCPSLSGVAFIILSICTKGVTLFQDWSSFKLVCRIIKPASFPYFSSNSLDSLYFASSSCAFLESFSKVTVEALGCAVCVSDGPVHWCNAPPFTSSAIRALVAIQLPLRKACSRVSVKRKGDLNPRGI